MRVALPPRMNSVGIFHWVAIVAAIATTTACSSTDGPTPPSGPTGPSSSGGTSGASGNPTTLDGSYSGRYQGDDSGPLKMTITGTTIDVVATVGGKDYPATGSVVAGGGVSVGMGVGNGVTVTFQGTFADGKGSGTWSSSVATNGTWSVAK